MKCPICGKKLITYGVDFIQGTLAEENNKCPKDHYSYDFHYGETVWKIEDKFLTYHYTQSEEEYCRIKKKVDKLIKKYKQPKKVRRLK